MNVPTPDSGYFFTRGYALAAASVMLWAARALEHQTVDAGLALRWAQRGSSDAAHPGLTPSLCARAIGMGSRRELLREALVSDPASVVELLEMQCRVLQGDSEDEDDHLEDDVEATLRMMRGFHLEAVSHGPTPAEMSC